MKRLIASIACLAAFFAGSLRADDLPFFSNLRAEVVNQITTVSNTIPFDKKLNSALLANLKLIDKTKPTFVTGASALGTLARNLGKTSLSNTFLPIVTDIRSVYLDTMEADKDTLEARLDVTVPSSAKTAAQKQIDKLTLALEATVTNATLTLSLKSLSKAATALAAAEKAVAKAESAKPGPSFLTATIIESNQGTNAIKVTRSTFLDAYMDSFGGAIEIEAGELKKLTGGRVQVRYLSMTAMVPGESGRYTLSLTNDSNAYYQRIISPNMAEFEAEEPEFEFEELYLTVDPFNNRLGTGTMTINVDIEANVVWGSFSFTASGSEDSNLQVSTTGSFLIRLSTYEEFEEFE